VHLKNGATAWIEKVTPSLGRDLRACPAPPAAGAALKIRLPGGGALLLREPPGASADTVVWRAAEACGLAPSQLALVCGGRRLGGPAPLRQACGLRGGGTLRIVKRLGGGGAGAGRMRDTPKKQGVSARRTVRVTFAPAREVAVDANAMAKWKELGGTELEAALASGAILLLDAKWVIALAARGGVLWPRQALPDEAFLSLSEVQASTGNHLSVVCISHCWLQPDHPDPHGHNLRAVARALKALTSEGKRVGVFFDFCSIYQNCRDRDGTPQDTAFSWLAKEGRLAGGAVGRLPTEDVLFKQALGSLGTFYSHPETHVLMLTAFPPDYFTSKYTRSGNVKPYSERGWCFCESSWATMVKQFNLVLDLGKDAGKGTFCEADCFSGRKVAVLPQAFVAQLASKGFTNGSADTPLVARLYQESFEERFRTADMLSYSVLGWGEVEACGVARLLLHAPALKALILNHNSIGDAGACALAKALPRAPTLRGLYFERNSIGDKGARALAEALPRALMELNLNWNSIGDQAARALAEALPRLPALRKLLLMYTSIRDEGARALAKTLPRTPELVELDLNLNSIGAEAKAALRTAWGARGGTLDLTRGSPGDEA